MKLASCSLLTALSLFGAMAAPVSAQSRPYADEGQTAGADRYLTAPNNVTDYPAAEVRAVPAAKARRAIARVERYEAYNTLQRSVRDSESDMLNSEAMTAAIAEEKSAFMALEAARDRALRALNEDEKYQTHRSVQAELGKRIAERHFDTAQATANTELVSLASAKLDFAKENRRQETELLARSTEVTDARARLIAARDRVKELQDEWRDQVKHDPALVAARSRHIESKIAHLAAEAYLEGVVESRNIALRYAYYLQRHNPYQVGYYSPFYGGDVLSRYR